MPMCAACKLADASKRNWKSSFTKKGIINKTDNQPGAGTSCDHLISHGPGLMPQVTGRSTHKRYCGAAIFTYHFSDLIYPHLITSTNMEETMEGKYAYDRFVYHHGIKIKYYRGNNMRYTETNFTDSCKKTTRNSIIVE